MAETSLSDVSLSRSTPVPSNCSWRDVLVPGSQPSQCAAATRPHTASAIRHPVAVAFSPAAGAGPAAD